MFLNTYRKIFKLPVLQFYNLFKDEHISVISYILCLCKSEEYVNSVLTLINNKDTQTMVEIIKYINDFENKEINDKADKIIKCYCKEKLRNIKRKHRFNRNNREYEKYIN